MTGLFETGGSAIAALVVVAAAVLIALVLPSGRAALAAVAGSVGRLPALIRDELRGAAPLRVDGAFDGVPDGPAAPVRDTRGDTTPDIPTVTRGLPVLGRADRR